MTLTRYYVILGLALFVVVISFLITIYLIRKQQYRETDDRVSKATVKHPLMLNPALIAYALFPLVIALGAYLYYIFVIK